VQTQAEAPLQNQEIPAEKPEDVQTNVAV